jgi:hypothetical protein
VLLAAVQESGFGGCFLEYSGQEGLAVGSGAPPILELILRVLNISSADGARRKRKQRGQSKSDPTEVGLCLATAAFDGSANNVIVSTNGATWGLEK